MPLRGRFTDVFPRVDRVLDTNGDGTGTKDSSVDGSVTQQIFKINPPAEGVIILERMLVEIRFTGAGRAQDYGDISGGLATGLDIGVFNESDDSLAIDYLDGIPIQTNAGWGRVCYDVDQKDWGAGDKFMQIRWTFTRAGTGTMLSEGDTAYFGVHIHDNLSTLVDQYFTVQGYSRS
jgi:hypothetical protein